MTVDNTDFRVPQKGVTKRGNTFTSRKYTGKSALRYELGVNILTGNLGVDPGSLPVLSVLAASDPLLDF